MGRHSRWEQDGVPPGVPQMSATTPIRPKWPRRHPWLTGITIILAAVGAGALVLLPAINHHARTQAAQNTPTASATPTGPDPDDAINYNDVNTLEGVLWQKYDTLYGIPPNGEITCSPMGANDQGKSYMCFAYAQSGTSAPNITYIVTVPPGGKTYYGSSEAGILR